MKQSESSQNQNQEGNPDLDKYLSALKSEDYNSSFARVGNWLEEADINLKSKQERKFISMENFWKGYISHNKRKFVYAFIVLLLVAVACNMPVTQQESLGHVISWSVDKSNTNAVEQIYKLPWFNNDHVKLTETAINGKTELNYKAVMSGATQEQMESYRKDLEKIKEVSTIKIYPLNEDVKRPLYSAALHNLFKVDINTSNMSDKEAQEQIAKQLKEAGIDNPQIEVRTDENGRRIIRMKVNDTDMKNGKNFELRVHDGNNEEVMKKVHIEGDKNRFAGKTDEEIRKLVKEDLKDADLKDSDIQIIRENGDVKIKVVKEAEK